METKSIKIKAFAKINVGLQIIGHLPDGFHEIETGFLPVTLHDTLFFEPYSSGIMIECSVPGIPLSGDNLIWKAVSVLCSRAGISIQKQGIRVILEKRIPVGAGLGGGSSDAAAAFKALMKMWNIHTPDIDIMKLALSIGADVPFFIQGNPAVGRGKGEQLTETLFLSNPWIVLIYPGFGISSAWAYKNLQLFLTKKRKRYNLSEIFQSDKVDFFDKNDSLNDFEESVFSGYPLLGILKEQLYETGAYFASLSGSGSTLYGFFDCKEAAEACLKIFQIKGYQVYLVKKQI